MLWLAALYLIVSLVAFVLAKGHRLWDRLLMAVFWPVPALILLLAMVLVALELPAEARHEDACKQAPRPKP